MNKVYSCIYKKYYRALFRTQNKVSFAEIEVDTSAVMFRP